MMVSFENKLTDYAMTAPVGNGTGDLGPCSPIRQTSVVGVTELRARIAKSMFHFDVPMSVCQGTSSQRKTTHKQPRAEQGKQSPHPECSGGISVEVEFLYRN